MHHGQLGAAYYSHYAASRTTMLHSSTSRDIRYLRVGSGWSIILAFTFTFGILSGQIGFVSLAPVTKYVLIVCYDRKIGNSLLEINTKIVFKFRSIITKFADPFCHSSTLLLIGRQRSRDLFFNPFLAFYWHIFMYLVFLTFGI